jgi:hypothetical protein
MESRCHGGQHFTPIGSACRKRKWIDNSPRRGINVAMRNLPRDVTFYRLTTTVRGQAGLLDIIVPSRGQYSGSRLGAIRRRRAA